MLLVTTELEQRVRRGVGREWEGRHGMQGMRGHAVVESRGGGDRVGS